MPARIGEVQPDVFPCFAFVASIFNTRDVSLILARITRGLLGAATLEARLIRRAACGHQEPMSIRLPHASRALRSSTNREGSDWPAGV